MWQRRQLDMMTLGSEGANVTLEPLVTVHWLKFSKEGVPPHRGSSTLALQRNFILFCFYFLIMYFSGVSTSDRGSEQQRGPEAAAPVI